MDAMTRAATTFEINADATRGNVWVNGFDGSCIRPF